MSTKAEALRLADWCEANSSGIYRPAAEAAAELRRLHQRCEGLEAALRKVLCEAADGANDGRHGMGFLVTRQAIEACREARAALSPRTQEPRQ